MTIPSIAQEDILDENIEIDVFKKSIIEVLKSIENTTNLEFFYNSDIIPEYTIISIKPMSNSIRDIFYVLFKTAGLNYELKENQVIIFKEKNSNNISKSIQSSIKKNKKEKSKNNEDFISIYDTLYTVIYDTITEKIYDTLITYFYDTLIYVDTLKLNLNNKKKINTRIEIQSETSIGYNVFKNTIQPISNKLIEIGKVSNASLLGQQHYLIDVNLSLNYNNFYFTSGVGFSMLNELYDYSKYNPFIDTTLIPTSQKVIVTVPYIMDVYYSDAIDNYVYLYNNRDSFYINNIIDTNIVEINNSKHYNKFYFLNFPININYEYKLFSNLKIGLYGKISSHILINSDIKTLKKDFTLNQIQKKDLQRFTFSFDIGLNAIYSINEFIYIKLLLGYSQFINSIYKEKIGLNYHPKYIKTSFCIIYRFSKIK